MRAKLQAHTLALDTLWLSNNTNSTAPHHVAPSTISGPCFGHLVPGSLMPFLCGIVFLCVALLALCCCATSTYACRGLRKVRATLQAHTRWMRPSPTAQTRPQTPHIMSTPSTVSDRCFGCLVPRSLLPFLCGVVFLSLALFTLCCCATGANACWCFAQTEASCQVSQVQALYVEHVLEGGRVRRIGTNEGPAMEHGAHTQ